MRVATDIGGTFTDLVYLDKETGQVGTLKTDSTPPGFEAGVIEAIERAQLASAEVETFVHGTTVVINTLTERKGAKTGLITTEGFRDVLEIARGNRPDLYNFLFAKPKPFVPRYLRLEVPERVNYKGEVLTPLNEEALAGVVEQLKAEGVEAVAISFLHSYANPTHEQRALERVRELWPEVSVSASHEITREWREYERTNTVVLNAYVHPVAGRYLSVLDSELRERGVFGTRFVMQSNGGTATFDQARDTPVTMVESGPVAGVFGAAVLGGLIGEKNLIALDIGGTTAKCSLIEDGQVKPNTEYKIEWSRTNPGYPIKTPVIDIVEIGNGGGSIAWLDKAGALHVGPHSAGAVPGPAAYGKGGTEPTTTDANLLTGRIDPDYFLGGEIKADITASEHAVRKLAEQLGMSVPETARGVIRLANANMVNALKLVSLNRGYDPREFTLVAFGGGGGMHATALAKELNIPKVVIPVNPAVFSAWGMLLTDLRRDLIRTRILRATDDNLQAIQEEWDELEEAAASAYDNEKVPARKVRLQRQMDMRYLGQEHTVKVPFPDGPVTAQVLERATRDFHDGHEQLYTFRLSVPVECVNFHLTAWGEVDKIEPKPLPTVGRSLDQARKGTRLVDFDEEGEAQADVFERSKLEPGMSLTGPAIIEEPAAVIVVYPGQQVEIDDYGNVHIRLGVSL